MPFISSIISVAETIPEERDYGPPPEQLSFDDQVLLEEARARSRSARWWAVGAMLLFFALVVAANEVADTWEFVA